MLNATPPMETYVRNNRRLFMFAAAALLLVSAGTKQSLGQAGKAESQPPSDSIAAYPANFPFAFDFLQTSYRFENDGTGRKDVTAEIHILSKSGAWQWAELRFYYKPSGERLEIPYIRIAKRDGSVVKVDIESGKEDRRGDRKEFRDLDYDEKRAYIPGLSTGDVLEYEAVTVIQHPLVEEQFWVQHSFQRNWAVDERLDIDVPSGRLVKLKTQSGIDAWETKDIARTIYSWRRLNPFLKEQRTATELQDDTADVQLSTFATWEEVGKWYAEIEKRRSVPTSEIRAKAEELTKGRRSDLEKAEAIYGFVAKNIKYLSFVPLGIGGYDPSPADAVLRKSAGDCKDKITLLITLLAAEGIHASSVLVNPSRALDLDVPSPWPFTHVVALLPLGNKIVWVDPSSEARPFGILPSQLHGKQGLVLPPHGVPRFEKIPSDAALSSEGLETSAK